MKAMNTTALTLALSALLAIAAAPALGQTEPDAPPDGQLLAQADQAPHAAQGPHAAQAPQVARNTEAAPPTPLDQPDPAVLAERMNTMRVEYEAGFDLMQSEHRAMRAEHEAMRAESRAEHEAMRAESRAEHRFLRAEHEAMRAEAQAEHRTMSAEINERITEVGAELKVAIAEMQSNMIRLFVGWTIGVMAILPAWFGLLRRYLPWLLGLPPLQSDGKDRGKAA